ncbi:esterase-like activity of phytase family protein [Cryptosporangium phraense]|uniref:Esterase-like activity of phytase family protein n=1 Tax=Cryptosporangium phraense TaxID=2593070 RepID=A0A545AJY6_9ACTN|nr:esterase-like activity of phytase family protein [Cryptosporangium phraense]TQS41055.1 esterase-like activity of phytase family protein [Cryptosporangium phraense]
MPRARAASAVLLTAALTIGAAAAGAPAQAHPAHPLPGLEFLGVQTLPNALQFQGTTVGGLSAISYDRRTGQYFIISDDRSAKNPARFYTAKIDVTTTGPKVTLTGTKPWLEPDGATFPPTDSTATPPVVAPDPEGIAVDPRSGRLFWSSEGERIVPATGTPTLGDPTIRVADRTGRTKAQLPTLFHMSAEQVGPRQNQTLEGLSFTPDGRTLYASMEDPLFQDGPDPSATNGALTRITAIDARTRKPVAQYAYPLEKLFATPPAADSTDTNGLSEALALGDGRLLVVERASIFETNTWKIRLYLADTRGATNVLDKGLSGKPMRKQLLLDLSDVPGLRLDNVEGATLGPRLKDGRRSLILVTDDNFNTAEVTEFLAFAVEGL